MRRVFWMGVPILGMAILVTSCASYNAFSLSNLSPMIMQEQKGEGVSVVAKAFNKADCRRYLDRDVLAVGYQPVQVYIENNSDRTFLFMMDRVSLACSTAEEVAEKVHTSTVGRVTGYGVGALFLWPLVIPAIVDGFKSSQANEALDVDFAGKVAGNQTIFPHSHFNKIIFVPSGEYQQRFSVTLIDAASREPKTIDVIATHS